MHLFKSDRRIILLLLFLLLVLIFIHQCDTGKKRISRNISKQEYDEFDRLQSIHESKITNKTTTWAPQRFDPNTADSITLLRFELKPWQVSNIIKYRNKGGRFYRAEDFSKIYGLSAMHFKRIKPYIHIEKTENPSRRQMNMADSARPHFVAKFPAGTVIELNDADTSQLKRIPGIGSYYARRIWDYGRRLGGYVSTKQLKEIEGLPAGVEKWFVTTTTIRRININKATFKQMIHHPYLAFDQVKAIVHYRDLHGPLQNIGQLSIFPEFTDRDIERIKPYLDF